MITSTYILLTTSTNSILIFLFILFLIDSCRAVHRCVRAMLDVDGGVGTSVNSVAADGTEGVLSSVLYWRLYRFSSYLAFADIKIFLKMIINRSFCGGPMEAERFKIKQSAADVVSPKQETAGHCWRRPRLQAAVPGPAGRAVGEQTVFFEGEFGRVSGNE